MSDEKKEAPAAEEGVMSPTQFRIGWDKQEDPDVMVFNIPLKRCAEDLEEGSAVLRGKIEEAKQIALKQIAAKRERKKMMTSIARPGVIPMPMGRPN